ncbi:hypothetical protein p17 [Rose leaf rosette-associated virus]|uniref:Uncharacterized protein n=1 Tax=Rose leaf rosette-associated virus TaxID=1543207 RepID=A0A088MG86_9CLOS|nr:hypothetical protein p17 [Rose leaf rosette-associated virus]AIN39547.1 hypothetical protein p17 [Rose leaf rosette-associated virus]
MRSYYSLDNFRAFSTLMTVLLRVVSDDHFDLTLFGHYCKVLSERLAVVMAMKADILSTSQDGDAEGAALKTTEMQVINKQAVDVTIALRKILLHRILRVFSARDTFEFVLQTYCRLNGVDRAAGLRAKARDAWQQVRVYLGTLYGLDIQ